MSIEAMKQLSSPADCEAEGVQRLPLQEGQPNPRYTKAPGMAVQALAGEIVNALLADEEDGGYDLTAGLFGAAFSTLVRRWADAEWARLPAAPVQPESFEQWNAKQHGDLEEIGFLQALRIAYCAGQDSVTKGTPPAAQQQWVGLTDEQLADCVPEGAHIIEREGERNRVAMTRQQLHDFVANVDKLRELNEGETK